MHLSQQFFKVNILNKHKILDKLPNNRVELHLFENIDSTNEECKRINQKKDFHVVIAEKQTMGKGRPPFTHCLFFSNYYMKIFFLVNSFTFLIGRVNIFKQM